MRRLPAVSILWILALSVASCDGPAPPIDQNELAAEAVCEIRIITSGGFRPHRQTNGGTGLGLDDLRTPQIKSEVPYRSLFNHCLEPVQPVLDSRQVEGRRGASGKHAAGAQQQ